MARGPIRHASEYAEPTSAPVFSGDIYPLYVPQATGLHLTTGLDRLFSDVDRQMRGEFRLAGGCVKQVEFGLAEQFSEVEDRHALDRLYWAARYARAAAFGHSGAIAGLQSSLRKWLQSARGPAALAAYTVAERIASLSEALFWIRHCTCGAGVAEIVSMKRQIWKDANRLSTHLEYGLGVHNHLLNDARGLFRASCMLPDLDEAEAWREQAFCLWDELFPKLVLEDGSFAEQSSHYQLLLCRTALEYVLAARLSHRTLPVGLEQRLSGMFQLANDLLRSDGSLPRFGDSSPDHTAEDLWGLTAAAYQCGLLKMRPRHNVITPLTLMYCGEPRLLTAATFVRDTFYPDGGFMFLRSPDESAELAVHGDPRPEMRAHGDAGRGSFELYWRGIVIVREPGSFLSSSNPRSEWSRSGQAQNVSCLDGLGPAITAEDRKFLPASYVDRGGAWIVCRPGELRFRWDGFLRIREGIVLWRNWQFDEAGDLSFEESIDGSGESRFESRFCLGKGRWEMTHRDSQRSPELNWSGPAGCSLSISLDLPPGVNSTLTTGCYIPEFGVEQETPVLILSGNVRLPVRWTAKWQFSTASREISSEELSQQCAG